MRFLLDANMPRSAIHAISEAGHFAQHVRDVGLGDATDADIDQYAKRHTLTLITRDLDFCDIRNYPPEDSPGRVVIRISDGSTAAEIVQLVRRYLTEHDLVAQIPGHLVIVETSQVRFRPALGYFDTSNG